MMIDNKQKQSDYVNIIEWLCTPYTMVVLVFALLRVPRIIRYEDSLQGLFITRLTLFITRLTLFASPKYPTLDTATAVGILTSGAVSQR